MTIAKRILVVEDETDILTIAIFRLEKAGYEVLTATDGKKAVEIAYDKKPNLILLDLRLPIMDGYEVCERLKRDTKTKNTPIILFTASAYTGMKEKIEYLGADDFVLKPFDYEELIAKIKRLTE